MSFNKHLVDSLKKELKVQKDQELAKIFEVTPFVFSSWKRSKSKLIEETVRYGIVHGLDFNTIFHGENNIEGKDISVLMAEDLFSYYLDPKKTVSSLPKYTIPVVLKSSIGFQVISQNMEPRLEVSSLVFGTESKLIDLVYNEIYVISVLNKGIFITRFKEQQGLQYIFENDNKRFPDFSFAKDTIVSVFKVNSVLGRI